MSQSNLADTFISIQAALARLVSGMVPPKEIEDIVQETYVRACQAEHRNEIRTPRSFLYRTARNLALDYTKRAETRLTLNEEFSEDSLFDEHELSDQTLNKVCSDEEFVMFCDAVRLLPTECRRTFVLKKVYGYSQREIAEELGLSQSTVEKHVAQGVKRCAQHMAERTESNLGSNTEQNQNTDNSVTKLKMVNTGSKK